MLVGLGMGMISAGVSVGIRAYTERETSNGITGSFVSYLTTAGLSFMTGFVSGSVGAVTGGLAEGFVAKAFASKTMSLAAKYTVKYGLNLGLETVGDAGVQYLMTGKVDWKQAFKSGLLDTAIGAWVDGLKAVARNWDSIKAWGKWLAEDELGQAPLDFGLTGEDGIIGRLVKSNSDISVPTVASGKFNEWFKSLSPDELDYLWQNKSTRKAIERQLRAPGGMHEWLLVSKNTAV